MRNLSKHNYPFWKNKIKYINVHTCTALSSKTHTHTHSRVRQLLLHTKCAIAAIHTVWCWAVSLLFIGAALTTISHRLLCAHRTINCCCLSVWAGWIRMNLCVRVCVRRISIWIICKTKRTKAPRSPATQALDDGTIGMTRRNRWQTSAVLCVCACERAPMALPHRILYHIRYLYICCAYVYFVVCWLAGWCWVYALSVLPSFLFLFSFALSTIHSSRSCICVHVYTELLMIRRDGKTARKR